MIVVVFFFLILTRAAFEEKNKCLGPYINYTNSIDFVYQKR